MAIIKFNSDSEAFNGSIQGQTFYSGNKISTIRNIASMPRSSTPAKKLMSNYLINSDRHWKSIDPVVKLVWNDFAESFPQRSQRSAARFLTGYELFVKRNQHFQIFHAGPSAFMEIPDFAEVFSDIPSISVFTLTGQLLISFDFPRSNSDLDCLVGLSKPISPALKYVGSSHRLVFKTQNISGEFDITDQYIKIFGQLPVAGQCLNFSLLQIGSLNAQYFFYPNTPIIVSTFVPPVVVPQWGYYYNSFNLASIAPTGWRVPTLSESYHLFSDTANCFDLVYPSNDFWIDSSGATNSKKFNAIGNGMREASTGTFILKYYRYFWANIGFALGSNWIFHMPEGTVTGSDSQNIGVAVRFVKDSAGFIPSVTGKNGIVYPCVLINGITWMAEDSRETKFNDGSDIPLVSDNLEWCGLTSQAYCINPD